MELGLSTIESKKEFRKEWAKTHCTEEVSCLLARYLSIADMAFVVAPFNECAILARPQLGRFEV